MKKKQCIDNVEIIRIAVSKDSIGNPVSNIIPEKVLNRYSSEQIEASMTKINGFDVLNCLAGKNEKGEINIVDVAVMPG